MNSTSGKGLLSALEGQGISFRPYGQILQPATLISSSAGLTLCAASINLHRIREYATLGHWQWYALCGALPCTRH